MEELELLLVNHAVAGIAFIVSITEVKDERVGEQGGAFAFLPTPVAANFMLPGVRLGLSFVDGNEIPVALDKEPKLSIRCAAVVDIAEVDTIVRLLQSQKAFSQPFEYMDAGAEF